MKIAISKQIDSKNNTIRFLIILPVQKDSYIMFYLTLNFKKLKYRGDQMNITKIAKEKFRETVENYNLFSNKRKAVMLMSGGKDASAAFDLLINYINGNDMDIEAIMVKFPRHVYEDKENLEEILNFWKSKGAKLTVFHPNIEEDVTENTPDGCKVCKTVRKSYIDPQLQRKFISEETVLITAYTLEDFLAYTTELGLLTNYTYQIKNIDDPKKKGNMITHLHKMKIKEELPNGFTIIRPLCDFLPGWTNRYVEENKIPVLSIPCKNASNKFKRLYAKAMAITKVKISYQRMVRFLEKNGVKFPETFDGVKDLNYFSDC